jgi:hypothetical protein
MPALAAAAIGAAGSLAGAYMSSSAAGDAADAQQQAARDANLTQLKINQSQLDYAKETRDKNIALQQPFRDTGVQANNALAYKLGLSTGVSAPKLAALKSVKPEDYGQDKWTGQLAPQDQAWIQKNGIQPDQMGGYNTWKAAQLKQAAADNVNIGKQNALANKNYQAQLLAARKNPDYGSLNKDFAEKFNDQPFNFKADPGYQFRLDQGNNVLDKRLAAMGLSSSGQALKEGMRFNQGEADQTYNQAYSRYNTDRGFKYNSFIDRYNQFNQNRQNKLQPLQSMLGAGQSATNQMQSANAGFGNAAQSSLQNYGQNVNNNILDAGNAKAAGYIGQANAWQQGINGVTQAAGSYFGKQNFAQTGQYTNSGYDPSAWRGA